MIFVKQNSKKSEDNFKFNPSTMNIQIQKDEFINLVFCDMTEELVLFGESAPGSNSMFVYIC